MNFHEYETAYAYAIKHCSIPKRVPYRTFYHDLFHSKAKTNLWNRDAIRTRCHIEQQWYNAMRPYYKVWPAVVNPLLRAKLDTPMNALSIGSRVITARLANGHEVIVDEIQLCALLICATTEGLVLSFDGIDMCTGVEITSKPALFPFSDNRTFEQYLADSEPPLVFVSGQYRKTQGTMLPVALRLALSLLLLADDPSIIEPDVLSKDTLKYEQTKDPKYIDRAKRRGKVGWHIGKTFETIPHYRRPHLALRHTGRGGSIPRIVPVKGSVVHRQTMATVPTGYITPDGVEIDTA